MGEVKEIALERVRGFDLISKLLLAATIGEASYAIVEFIESAAGRFYFLSATGILILLLLSFGSSLIYILASSSLKVRILSYGLANNHSSNNESFITSFSTLMKEIKISKDVTNNQYTWFVTVLLMAQTFFLGCATVFLIAVLKS